MAVLLSVVSYGRSNNSHSDAVLLLRCCCNFCCCCCSQAMAHEEVRPAAILGLSCSPAALRSLLACLPQARRLVKALTAGSDDAAPELVSDDMHMRLDPYHSYVFNYRKITIPKIISIIEIRINIIKYIEFL